MALVHDWLNQLGGAEDVLECLAGMSPQAPIHTSIYWRERMPAAYRVYVLQNLENRFYIGLTDDVSRRLNQHNSGTSLWTKGKGPWVLRWQSEELSLSDARSLENALKRQKGGSGFYKMTGLPRS